MDRFSALVAAFGMLGLGAFSTANDDRPIVIAAPQPGHALFTVLRICFPATATQKTHCIDDHGRVFDPRGVSERDCTRIAAAKVGTLASGARILRGYCQQEPDRESYQVSVPGRQE